MVGPFFAGMIGPWIARMLGDDSPGAWRYGLYLFALITLLSWLWIKLIRIEESHPDREPATLRTCFSLLGNNYVLLMVLGIFSVVGIDVAINSNIGTFLSEKLGVGEDAAKYAKSLYFLAKMIGTFVGALLLMRIAPNKFLLGSSILLVLSLTALAFTPSETSAWIIIFIVSLMASNIFPLIFAITVGSMPDRANEISGLMMMAISGGALIPFLTGYAMSQYVNGGILVLVVCALYLVIISLRSLK
jgi:fucose permease